MTCRLPPHHFKKSPFHFLIRNNVHCSEMNEKSNLRFLIFPDLVAQAISIHPKKNSSQKMRNGLKQIFDKWVIFVAIFSFWDMVDFVFKIEGEGRRVGGRVCTYLTRNRIIPMIFPCIIQTEKCKKKLTFKVKSILKRVSSYILRILKTCVKRVTVYWKHIWKRFLHTVSVNWKHISRRFLQIYSVYWKYISRRFLNIFSVNWKHISRSFLYIENIYPEGFLVLKTYI